MRRIIKLDKETYDALMKSREEYRDSYIKERFENKELQGELGYYKALCDKEDDTEVIKYNSKIYRIVSKIHRIDRGEAETLDIEAIEMIKEEELGWKAN